MENNTLPKTILVKRNDGPGSLVTVTTPRLSPRRPQTGVSALIPVEIESRAGSPKPRGDVVVMEERIEVFIEEVPYKKEERVLQPGEITCPFKTLGCQKVGQQRDVQIHIRDDRDYHMALMAKELQKLGQDTQQSFQLLRKISSQYWIGQERAGIIVRKFGPQFVFKTFDIGKAMYKSYQQPNKTHLIYSDIFETHRFGYKMVVIMDPFGDGEARTKYISVFAALLKGEFDPILEWPFPCPVTFTLRKPGTLVRHEKTLDPASFPDLEKFGRPVAARNRAFGFQMYYPIAKLCEYCVLDDIYIEINVDLTKIGPKKV